MFLSLFPFPEVATIIAICLAWIFIALGVMGTNQTAEVKTPSPENHTPAQISIYQIQDINFSEKTCFWQQISKKTYVVKNHKAAFYFDFLPCEILKYPITQEFFPGYTLSKNIPNRAPPVV